MKTDLGNILLKATIFILLILELQSGYAQETTTSLSFTANPLTARIGNIEIDEHGIGFYPVEISQTIGQEIGIGVNITGTANMHWGGGFGFSFKQINKSYQFWAPHPLASFNPFFHTDTLGYFKEHIEVERFDFNLHGRLIYQSGQWRAQLLVGYNQPVITKEAHLGFAEQLLSTFVQDDVTGEEFNHARRSIYLLSTINNAAHNFLAELYLGKKIKNGLFLNSGIKYSLPNSKIIVDYRVNGNLGEANGFEYDETDYQLNNTRITNRMLMLTLGVTYDIPFRNIF